MNYAIDGGNGTYYKTTLEKLMLFGTKHKYQIPYIRNFDLSVGNLDVLDAFERAIRPNQNMRGSNYNPRKITSGQCASVLSNMINISATPVGAAQIDNGWDNERFRFVLVVRNVMGNINQVSYVQGYTDYTDVSYSGLVDPNSKFYINSITVVNEMIDPINGMKRSNIIGTFNVIASSEYAMYERDNDYKLIRPKDLIYEQSIVSEYGGGVTNNTTNNIDPTAKASTRANNNPVEYLGRTVNSYIDGYNQAHLSYNPRDVFSNAEVMADEYDIYSNPFIRELYKINYGFNCGYFTFGNLAAIDPTIPTRTNMFVKEMTPSIQDPIFDTEHTQQMLQPTAENLKANYIAGSVSSILTEALMTRIIFSMTNFTGTTELYVLDAQSMLDGVFIEHQIGKVESRLRQILESKLVDFPGALYNIHVKCDVFGDTTIIISLNNEPEQIFRFPSFADSLFAPVITNRVGAETIGNEVANLFDAIGAPVISPEDIYGVANNAV